MKDTERFYINENGDTVFTAEYYLKKGSCCKSNCLHCPFGTTLRNLGVKLHPFYESKQHLQIFNQLFKPDSMTQSLLDGAFGNTPQYKIEDSYRLSLKDVVCGVCILKENKIVKLRLLDHFSHQGITETYIQSLIE